MDGKIKRISIGVDIPKQFHYGVGSIFPVYINNQRIETVINNIEETEKAFLIFVKYDGEIHKWKRIGKHEFLTIEFFID